MSALPFDGVEHLVKVVDQLDADHPEGQEDVPTLAQFLVCLDRLIQNVRAYRSRIEQEVAKRADTKLVEFPGGTAEIKAGAKRTQWDNDLLISHVTSRALDERQVDEETGEYEPEGQAVSRVLAECARPSWRVTALRKHGIQPDDFCQVEWGTPSVIVRAHEPKGESE